VLKKDTQRDVQESEKELLATKHMLKCEQESHKNLQNQSALQAAKLAEQVSTAAELALQVKQLEGERESLFERMIQNDVAIEAAQREAKNLREASIEKDKVNKELSRRLVIAESTAEEMEIARREADEIAERAVASAEQSKLMEQEAYERASVLEREAMSIKAQLEEKTESLVKTMCELAQLSGHQNSKQKIQYTQDLKNELVKVTEKNAQLSFQLNEVQRRLKLHESENDEPKRNKTPGKSPLPSLSKDSQLSPCTSPLTEKCSNIE
jgi:hypothetical protein